MKKYSLGLATIVCEITFSIINKLNAQVQFKLLNDPITAGITDPNQWSDGAIGAFGRCDTTPEDLANVDGTGDLTSNDNTYANAQNPKQDYIIIAETIGANPDRKIASITFKHFHICCSEYRTVTFTQGTDYDFKNARN